MKSPFIEHFIRPLLWGFRIVLVIFALAFIYTVIILWFPDSTWNPFQPTVSGNIAVLASLLVALGTLGLAYATFETIHRNIQREDRDRKERLLNEIKDWALEAAHSAISRQTRVPSVLWETRLKYKYSLAKSPYVIEIAESSFSGLSSFIRDITLKLEQCLGVVTDAIEKKGDGGRHLVESEQELRESVERLLRKLGTHEYTVLR